RGASLEYEIVTVLPTYAAVQILDAPVDGFYPLQYGSSIGWASGQYLHAGSPPANPTPNPASVGAYGFRWPLIGPITSYFGPSHPLGIDIGTNHVIGIPVGAANDGTVIFAGGNPCCSYGLYV